MKRCNECGREISDRARTYPHCGDPKPHQSPFERMIEELGKAFMWFALAAAGIVVLLLALNAGG